jgi:RimK family alpha-L-glutamate ligase
MKILIAGLKKDYQLVRLREEGKNKGHIVDGCYSSELTIVCDKGSFKPTLRGKSLDSYNLIYLMVSKRRWEWYTACLYLSKKNNTISVNQKSIDASYNLYMTPAIDYLRQTESDLSYPKSALIYSKGSIDSVISEFKFPVIVKNAQGRQGKGVFKVNDKEELIEKVSELEKMGQAIVVREFIPNAGDVRVFCVGKSAIGAMKRTPNAGEFRSNISLGGTGAKFDLEKNPEVKKMAERAAEITRTEIAGVDIIINKETGLPYILEVNPGPQFEGLEKYTGVNAAGKIIEYFEKLLSK